MKYSQGVNNNNNNTHKPIWDFKHSDRSPNPGQKTRPYNNQQQTKKKKIRNLQNCRLAVPADHRTILKECEKKEKYLDLARELKKLWNMKVTIVPIVIGAKGLLKVPGGPWKLVDG